jgi:hypothetical protein
MKTQLHLEKQKGMKEADVRASIEKAAAKGRELEMQRGNGDVSQDRMREKMAEYAEKDRREGKI